MYISLQASNLIDQQIFKLGLNIELNDIDVFITDFDQSSPVAITDINTLKQYGDGHHLDVISSLGNRLNLQIVKDVNRKPNCDETFSSLLLKSNRMKHIQIAEDGYLTHDDLLIVNEKQLDRHLYKALTNPSNCKPLSNVTLPPVEEAKERMLKRKLVGRYSNQMFVSKHQITKMATDYELEGINRNPLFDTENKKRVPAYYGIAHSSLEADSNEFWETLTDNCHELKETSVDTTLEMGIPFGDYDTNAPHECPDDFEDKYVPRQHPVSPLMESVLKRFKK